MSKKKQKSGKKTAKPAVKKNALQKFFANRGLSAAVTALLVVVLIVAVVLIATRCGKKEAPFDGPVVQISEDYQHKIPSEFDVNDIITMKNDTSVKDYLRVNGGYSTDIDPKPCENGWLIFDDDGIARKYRDVNGDAHDLPVSEQVEHLDVVLSGAPLMIVGEVKMHFIVYRDENNQPAACYQYYTLSQKGDMEYLLNALNRCGAEAEQVSDTVAEVVWDAEFISDLLVDAKIDGDISQFMSYLGETYNVTR